MAERDDHEKTEEPTPKKLEQLREHGQIAQSREVALAATVLGGAWVLAAGGPELVRHTTHALRATLTALADGGPSDLPAVLSVVRALVWPVTGTFVPLLCAIAAIAVGATLVQVRPTLAWKAIRPDLSRLDPVAALGRRFSPQVLTADLLKHIVKVAVVGAMVAWALRAEQASLALLGDMATPVAGDAMAAAAGRVALRVGLGLAVVALLDVLWQRRRWHHEAMMTREEVKQENRQREGSPEVRRRQRARAQELSRNRMMREAARADVVLVNPTHYAVALRYRAPLDRAPRVVARGQGPVALAIRKAARRAGVPIIEDRPLARLLYRTVRLGREVPEDLFAAVATVLAQVYRMTGRRPPVHT
jgi:flagellar biosynthetic protein FlhB